jgi:hypothetical protein
MMIPGAWEPRQRPPAAVTEASPGSAYAPTASVPNGSADTRDRQAETNSERPDLPTWLELSIFAAALLVATWLAMWGAHFTA